VIETLKLNFDIPIHHYLEVGFAGFQSLVDAVGGVPIYFTTPARDTFTGLTIRLPGCYEMNGSDALAYVRSRHYEFKETADEDWREDPYADLGRIQRQQYFIRSLAEVAIKTAARRPLKANNILNKAFASITKDEALGLSDVNGLARTLRETDPAVVRMLTIPTQPSGDGATLVIDDALATPVFEELRSFGTPEDTQPEIPDDIAPADVTVKVLNGSGVSGAARATLEALAEQGFAPLDPPADADRSDYETTEIRYAPGAQGKAQLVAAYVGTGTLVQGGNFVGSDVTVVLGRDFEEITPPRSAPETTAPATTSATTPTTQAHGPAANPGQTPGVKPQPLVGCG
jgi:LCP family protein required for cell wall assembly